MKLNFGSNNEQVKTQPKQQEEKPFFKVLKVGDYKLNVLKAELTNSKQGKPMVVIEFGFAPGEDYTDYPGRTIREYFSLGSEYAITKLGSLLNGVGIDTSKEVDLESIISKETLIGETVLTYVGIREYESNGKKRLTNNVVNFKGNETIINDKDLPF